MKRLTAIIFFIFAFFIENASCAVNYKVKNIVIDNSDKTILIEGDGDFREERAPYAPTPNSTSTNQAPKLVNNLTTFTLTNPTRYVIDIPNASIVTQNKIYKLKNSKVIQKIEMSQNSANPAVVRVVFTLFYNNDLSKFKTYSDGKSIIVKYNNQLLNNSIQHKFYTASGDTDKTNIPQTTTADIIFNDSDKTIELSPKLDNKYFLSMVSQTSDGLVLRGVGEVSHQRIAYNQDNTKAELILDSSGLLPSLEGKSYNIPSSTKKEGATLTINKLNSKKVKLTLLGESLRDYRIVASPDGQSLFVCHRSYIINTAFAINSAKINSYSLVKNSNGYYIFDLVFDKSVAYDVFELNDNFYLDINNLSDINQPLLEKALKDTNLDIKAQRISLNKMRYIIPSKNLNFSYGNIESNSKSIKLCFKEKPQSKENEAVVSNQTQPKENPKTDKKSENINVVYIPKQEEETKIIYKEPKKKKEATISALKKVVLDPGHGGTDSGAIGAGTVYEKSLNLTVAKLVEEKLKKKNINVYMTREKDVYITLEDRCNFSNEINPDLYISIHANSTVEDVSYGVETHYFKEDSLELANTIHNKFASEKNLKKWDTKNRGVIKSRFYVINHTEAPSILIEMGFISNAVEREKLLTKQRQEEIANSIAEGIFEYLKVK